MFVCARAGVCARKISISRLFSCEAAIFQIRSRLQQRNPPLMNICLNPTSSEFAADAEKLDVVVVVVGGLLK